MIVKNMLSLRSGKPIANQFIITVDNMEIFHSYKTVIAVRRADNPEGSEFFIPRYGTTKDRK